MLAGAIEDQVGQPNRVLQTEKHPNDLHGQGAPGAGLPPDLFLSLCFRLQPHWPSSYPSATLSLFLLQVLGTLFSGMLSSATQMVAPQPTHFISDVTSSHRNPWPYLAKHHPPPSAPGSTFLAYYLVTFLCSTYCYRYYISYLFGYNLVSYFYLLHIHNPHTMARFCLSSLNHILDPWDSN